MFPQIFFLNIEQGPKLERVQKVLVYSSKPYLCDCCPSPQQTWEKYTCGFPWLASSVAKVPCLLCRNHGSET